MDAVPIRSTSYKPTWKMTARELSLVVAEHYGYTRRGSCVRDERGRFVAMGYDALAEKMSRLGYIVEGSGVNWRAIGVRPQLPTATRSREGYWR